MYVLIGLIEKHQNKVQTDAWQASLPGSLLQLSDGLSRMHNFLLNASTSIWATWHDKLWLKLSHFALMPDHVTALCTCHRRVWNTTQARYTSRNTRSLRGWQCKWPTSKQCTIVGCVKLQFVRPMTHFRCLLWVQRCMLPYCTLDRWEVDQMVGFCGSDVLFSSHASLAKCVCVSKYSRSKNRAVQLVHRHSRKLWYHYSTRLLDASDVSSWKNPLWRHHDIFTPIVQ